MFPSTTVKTSYFSNVRGSGRIRVATPQGNRTVALDHELVGTEKHLAAIKAVYGEGATVEYVTMSTKGGKITYTWKVFA